ncbi:hypothetical protein [Vibrio parahaemolyticus]|uniref:hypothetical protein n=1 Tax=Vibrio parahaemolyticus TaxID=670 RepID=UPI0016858829|nr:hypothetical protein [Vibrio parahaemolyticus]
MFKNECWLCRGSALVTEMDHDNREFYQCDNDNCGDYVITKSFKEKQSTNVALRTQLQDLATKYKNSDKIPLGWFLKDYEIKLVSR